MVTFYEYGFLVLYQRQAQNYKADYLFRNYFCVVDTNFVCTLQKAADEVIEGGFVLTCDLEELNIVTKIHPSSMLTEFSDFDSMPYIKHTPKKEGKVHPITCHEATERA